MKNRSGREWAIDPSFRDFSPAISGVSGGFIAVFLLSLWPIVSQNALPKFTWILLLIYVVSGLLLQLITNRLLWIRCYQLFGNSIVLGIIWVLMLQLASTTSFGWEVVAVCIFVISSLNHGIRRTRRVSEGSLVLGLGKTDPSTGLLDPYAADFKSTGVDHSASVTDRVATLLLPIAAGITLFMLNLDSIDGTTILMWVLVVAGSWVFAVGTGGFIYLTYVTALWERCNHKQVRLQPKPLWPRKTG